MNPIIKYSFISVVMSTSLYAQKDEGGGVDTGGGATGADCNGLGNTTTISNGRYYAQTEANDPIVGGGSGVGGGVGGGGVYVDPGLSIISNISNNTGVLAGSSMRLQSSSSGATGIFAGVTTKASCVSSASLAVPTWGGSSRTFWDTNSGVTPDVTTFPMSNQYATSNGSIYACWDSGGTNVYDFTYTLNFSNNTTVDGIYWETVGPITSGVGGAGGSTNNFQILVDGVPVSGASTNNPFFTGNVTDSNGASGAPLNHYYIALGQSLTGSHTITLRSTGNVDPALGDFAVMGCCPVPEPSSAILLVSGCGILLTRRKR